MHSAKNHNRQMIRSTPPMRAVGEIRELIEDGLLFGCDLAHNRRRKPIRRKQRKAKEPPRIRKAREAFDIAITVSRHLRAQV